MVTASGGRVGAVGGLVGVGAWGSGVGGGGVAGAGAGNWPTAALTRSATSGGSRSTASPVVPGGRTGRRAAGDDDPRAGPTAGGTGDVVAGLLVLGTARGVAPAPPRPVTAAGSPLVSEPSGEAVTAAGSPPMAAHSSAGLMRGSPPAGPLAAAVTVPGWWAPRTLSPVDQSTPIAATSRPASAATNPKVTMLTASGRAGASPERLLPGGAGRPAVVTRQLLRPAGGKRVRPGCADRRSPPRRWPGAR